MSAAIDFFGETVRSVVQTDDIDLRILSLLREDARLSARGVAREIQMSAGAVSERISRLERGGVIAGYRTQINQAALGYGLLAIVGLRTAHGPSLLQILKRTEKIPEVEAIYVVTGQWDLMVHLRVRDQHHLGEVLFGRICKTAGFQHSETMVTLHEKTHINAGAREAVTKQARRVVRRPKGH
jgi:DNA-binding Lrp family transcriptional regulator